MLRAKRFLRIPRHRQEGAQQCDRFQAPDLSREGFLAGFKACGILKDLDSGKRIHRGVLRCLAPSISVSNSLIAMYAKSGSILDARRVFDSMARHDVVSWTALISGYVENGESNLACECFDRMTIDCEPDARTFLAMFAAYGRLAAEERGLQVCGKPVKISCIRKGMALHYQVSRKGCDRDIFVASSLVDLYAKCGSMVDARIAFDKMPEHNVVTWTSLMIGYVENGEAEITLSLFSCIEYTGLEINSRALVAMLMACGTLALKEEGTLVDGRLVKIASLERGIVLHELAKSRGLDSETFVANSLIAVFSKVGSLERARRVFDKMETRNVVSWTSLILGYTENGEEELALDLFENMKAAPNAWTFTTVLTCCAALAAKSNDGSKSRTKWLEKVASIRSQAVKCGYSLDVFVVNTLIFAYSKCGRMEEADRVFRSIEAKASIVSWTSMIVGHVENGEHELALEFYTRMKEGGCVLDSRVFVAALTALASLSEKESSLRGQYTKLQDTVKPSKWLEIAASMHTETIASGLEQDIFVANSLLDVYAKCGSMEDAEKVFRKMGNRNTISWNTMILAYVRNGDMKLALEAFASMRLEARRDCAPDSQTFITVLTALGSAVTGLETGGAVHAEMCRNGLLESSSSNISPATKIPLTTSLITFYAKSAAIMNPAQHVFDSVTTCKADTAIWNALISGYSSRGNSFQVFSLFDKMRHEGIRPDEVTFQSLLTVCSHAGLVDKAIKLFREMSSLYGIVPSLEHYTSVIDLLARASRVEEAVELLQRMPCEADVVVWMSVLSACCRWKELDLGQEAFKSLLQCTDKRCAAYVLVSNMCK